MHFRSRYIFPPWLAPESTLNSYEWLVYLSIWDPNKLPVVLLVKRQCFWSVCHLLWSNTDSLATAQKFTLEPPFIQRPGQAVQGAHLPRHPLLCPCPSLAENLSWILVILCEHSPRMHQACMPAPPAARHMTKREILVNAIEHFSFKDSNDETAKQLMGRDRVWEWTGWVNVEYRHRTSEKGPG